MIGEPRPQGRPTPLSILAAVATVAVGLLVIVPLGLCGSFVGLGLIFQVIGWVPPLSETGLIVLICIPVVIACIWLIWHAIRVALNDENRL